ncbi:MULTISPECIES: ATP-binding protein [Acidocella]|uniref:ATP-binding protein n=1 Tax=Acidocella TaxID=50709 RepID=UPI00028D313D|nr:MULTISPECIES: ATP-binding protein [Acidocella]EKM98392.1 multi-sensor hybrid histidine kinase [Acidocella sp. MX-AZ02]WBO59237.1 ATP-binding protein [Acidocella sp. MX-AZ03]
MRTLNRAGDALRRLLAPLAQRLRGRPDSEHEMSYNRLVFAALIIAILILGGYSETALSAFVAMAIYLVLALAGLAHIIWRPGVCQVRRFYALLLDCGFLSWQLHLGGERVALFYPVYLWVIFGNGFRFGLRFLAVSVPVATLGFLAVVLSTPFWRAMPHLSAGLAIGLVILPAYAGTLIKKLSQATKAAEEASKAKSMFLASVSHELRTPLTAIIGMNELLRASRLDSAQAEMVETVGVASHSLQTLINQLLDFSRIEAGRMTSTVEEFDLLALLVDVRRIVESQVREKSIAFNLHVTPRTPVRIKTSRLHLQEILINLVGNAVKFTSIGGVVLAVDTRPGGEGELILQVEVSDTGIGIAAEAQAKIFESFTQGDASILNRFGGTGLGLAITKRLVGLLGGEIAVQSKLGEGSQFRFFIKALRAEPTEEIWQAPPGKIGLRVRNPLKRALMRTNLAAMGAEVELVNPGTMVPADVRILVDYNNDGEPPSAPVSSRGAAPMLIQIQPVEGPGLPDLATRQRCTTLLSDDFSDQELQQALLIAGRFCGVAPPIATSDELPAAAPRALDAEPEPAPLPVSLIRRNVLLVDDNRVNQRVFTRILEAAGHNVTVADNGNLAVDILEREDERFDIVLMDFNMPGLDGLEATKLYRVMALGRDRLPIVGLTADAFAQMSGEWRSADMDGCLVKPVAPQDLVAAVEKMARMREPSSVIARLEEWIEPPAPVLARPAPEESPLDDAIIANLRLLGDSQFLNELLSDFLSDAKDLIDLLSADAEKGDGQEFRNHAHALRSSAANVGAKALGNLCTPWGGLRGSELKAQAGAFTSRAHTELKRTRQAVMALGTIRRANNQ